jgi:hypothetical protein
VPEDSSDDESDARPGNKRKRKQSKKPAGRKHNRPTEFATGAPITIISGDGEAMAHGKILDDEVDTSMQDKAMQYGDPGYWKQVALSSVVKGWAPTVLQVLFPRMSCNTTPHVHTNTNTPHMCVQADEVFDGDVGKISSKHRRLGKLALRESDQGFVIWHEYVVARMRPKKRAK